MIPQDLEQGMRLSEMRENTILSILCVSICTDSPTDPTAK